MEIPQLLPPATPSSSIIGIGYNPTDKILFVEFKNTGVYAYHDFDPGKYKQLLKAESAGKYIAREVAPNHFYKKIQKTFPV